MTQNTDLYGQTQLTPQIDRATSRIQGLASPAAYVMRRDRVDQLVSDLKQSKELSQRLDRQLTQSPESDIPTAEVQAYTLVRQLARARKQLRKLSRQLVQRKVKMGGIAAPPPFPTRAGKHEIVREVTAALKMAMRVQKDLWLTSAAPRPGMRPKPATLSRRVIAVAARLMPREYRGGYWRDWVSEVRELDPVPRSRWRRFSLATNIFVTTLLFGRHPY